MKIVWQWVLGIMLYVLLYTGATDLWPMLAHIHHNDHQLPVAIGIALNGVVIPFGIGFLIAVCLRRELLGTALPFLVAPFLLGAATGYVTDSFYPPYSQEFLSLVGAGAMQGVSALLGWGVHRRFSGRRQASTPSELPAVSV